MKLIQVGANRGHDDLSKYILSNHSTLEFALFVEPNKVHMADLTECYKDYSPLIENVAIVPNTYIGNELELFYQINDPDFAITSCKKEHIHKHLQQVMDNDYNNGIFSFIVPCMSLEQLFEKYNIVDLDWLLLDIEGLDAEILLSVDWQRYNIKHIEYEYIHLSNEDSRAIIDIFLNLGYMQVPALSVFDNAFERVS